MCDDYVRFPMLIRVIHQTPYLNEDDYGRVFQDWKYRETTYHIIETREEYDDWSVSCAESEGQYHMQQLGYIPVDDIPMVIRLLTQYVDGV